jgi:hypothetical protein
VLSGKSYPERSEGSAFLYPEQKAGLSTAKDDSVFVTPAT